MKEKKLADEK